MFVSLTPPYSTSFEIEREVLNKGLEERNLGKESFKKAADEIGSILLALLNDTGEEYIAREIESDGSTDEEKESLVRSKVDLVKDTLYDGGLRLRYDLKRSRKAPSFSGIDWDIKVKHIDGKWEAFDPFPYATCRISYQREFDDSPWTFFGGRAFDAIQINFSADELDYLVKVLTGIKSRLRELEP